MLRLENYYLSKGYFIVPVVRFSQRGRATLFAASREIDCKPKMKLEIFSHVAHLLRICIFVKIGVSNCGKLFNFPPKKWGYVRIIWIKIGVEIWIIKGIYGKI